MASTKQTRKFSQFKQKVIALRKKGLTYGEIRESHKIPKSTLSIWLKKIKIPTDAKAKMKKRAYERWKKNNDIFIKRRIEDALKIRVGFQNKARKEIKKIDLKLIGACLYWAEGNKKNRHFLRFANSDPEIIKIMMRFFREICFIQEQKIKARAHIYPGMNYKKVLNFWSKITRLKKSNFQKPQTQISAASKRKRARNTLPYGTLHLVAGNTEMASRVKGWIEGIIEIDNKSKRV